MNVQSEPLRARLRGPWTPLGSLAGTQLGTAPLALTALTLDRATRDRLVIFDPASAYLIRPFVAVADLAPWHSGAAGRWVIAIPRSELAAAQRFTALLRHLASLPVPPEAHSNEGPWWVLDEAATTPPPAPRIIVAAEPPVVAWDAGIALVGGPAQVVAAAEPYWLALLASPLGRALLSEGGGDLANFPIPEAPGPVGASLAGLALSAANLATQIDELERAVLRRLLADFGPPGVPAGPLLRRWWSLAFDDLRAAVLAELRNDIPERFRATWAQVHGDERATHQRARARLAELEEAIAGQVQGLYGLT